MLIINIFYRILERNVTVCFIKYEREKLSRV